MESALPPKPAPPRKADPCPRAILGGQLIAGMVTFQRVVDSDGNVKFKRDLELLYELEPIGCRNGIHFRARKGDGEQQVCYFMNAEVWVKDE
jgi:hypothetical protein